MAALFDQTTPVANAQITAAFDCRRDLSSLLEVVRWRVISSGLEGSERVFRVALEARSTAAANLNQVILRLRPQDSPYSVAPNFLDLDLS